MGERPWGPDVSHYQGRINWPKVKAAGAGFVFLKATEGTSVDSRFHDRWSGIYKAGFKIRGAYHYAHIEGDPIAQARFFVSTLLSAGKITAGDFLILDAEDVDKDSRRISPRATAAWVKAWLDEVVRLTGLPRSRVLVYTGPWWWNPRTGDSAIAVDHSLWLSKYVAEPSVKPDDWLPWRIWRFWQYTDKRFVSGIGPCDASYFNGSSRGLWWLSGRPLRLFGK